MKSPSEYRRNLRLRGSRKAIEIRAVWGIVFELSEECLNKSARAATRTYVDDNCFENRRSEARVVSSGANAQAKG